jgi:uncharacterized membrane protein YebE (DUF533 family)
MRHISSQQGFSFVEILIAGVVVAGMGFLGYTFYNNYQAKKVSTAGTSQTVTDVPAAPAITTAAELDKASTVIDQTDSQASSTNDLSQLDGELSNF